MRKITNDCCGCDVPGYPCRGESCPNRHVTHTFCDVCGGEELAMYTYDGRDYCPDCLLRELTRSGLIDTAPSAPEC